MGDNTFQGTGGTSSAAAAILPEMCHPCPRRPVTHVPGLYTGEGGVRVLAHCAEDPHPNPLSEYRARRPEPHRAREQTRTCHGTALAWGAAVSRSSTASKLRPAPAAPARPGAG